MATKALPPQELLVQRLRYEPDTGHLFYRHDPTQSASWNTQWSGKRAFNTVRGRNYTGYVNSQLYSAHRIIWKMVKNEEPPEIDHINGNRFDNRIENLRACSRQENARNLALPKTNTTGVVGVYWCTKRKKYHARIKVNNKPIHLGRYDKIEDAKAAREQANIKYGFHKNHGTRMRFP